MRRAIRALIIVTILLSSAISGAQTSFPDGTVLSIKLWHHFVPRYDEWFDGWAQSWGESNNVDVSIDHVALTDMPALLATAIDAGEGPTLFEMPTSSAAWVDGLHDLRQVNQRASQVYGDALPYCQAYAYLPATDHWYGFTAGLVVFHGNYDIALWTDAGYPAGPQSWAELLEGGRAIYEATGVPVGIGISPEADSEMALRSIIWSFGGSLQDEDENVTLNSPQTIAALEYIAQLHEEAMTDEVFGWGPPSNNQALIAGDASFILNPSSAYRSLQTVDEAAAAGIGISGALAGPAAELAGANVLTHVIPAYVTGADLEAAERFLLDYLAAFNDATWHSELYNLPCYPASAPQLDDWLADDPFGSRPADKLAPLISVSQWSAQLGYPGRANPAISQVYAERIIPNMAAQVALGELSAAEAAAQAHERVEAIFGLWRERGLVGGQASAG